MARTLSEVEGKQIRFFLSRESKQEDGKMAGEERNLMEAIRRFVGIRERLTRERLVLEQKRNEGEIRVQEINEALALLDKHPEMEKLWDLTSR